MLGRVLFALAFGVLAGCFGEATLTSSNGMVASCAADTDCPQDDKKPCFFARCTEGSCQQTNLPAGTRVGDQAVGDCTIDVCDGEGHVIQQSDGTDVADDGNPCTLEGCSPEGPLPPAQAPAGTVCGPKACCDPRGMCIGDCVSDEDCGAPPDSSCATAWCNDCGQCDLALAPQGTFAAGDQPGDCVTLICDGSGNVIPVADKNDVPFDEDFDLCTIEYCEGEMPSVMVMDCPYPQACYRGMCL